MIELIISQLSGECFYFEHIYLVATNTVIFLKTVPEILIAMQVNCLHLDKYIYVMKFKFSLILQDTKIFFLFEKVAKALFWFSFESIVIKGVLF